MVIEKILPNSFLLKEKKYDKEKDVKQMTGIQRTDNAGSNCVYNSSLL